MAMVQHLKHGDGVCVYDGRKRMGSGDASMSQLHKPEHFLWHGPDAEFLVQIPYSGFAVASRALLMHCTVRIIRTIGFLSVVMPHPKHPHCFAGKFPAVPEKMSDYILTGISTLKGGGGCNDLIMRCALLPMRECVSC